MRNLRFCSFAVPAHRWPAPRRAWGGGLTLLLLLCGLTIAIAAPGQEPAKIDPKSSAQFLRHVSLKRYAQRGDCIVAASLILDSKHWRRDYRRCRRQLHGLPNVIFDDPDYAAARATRAYAARLVAGVLGIYAGYSRRLAPTSGRYAYRDLVALQLMVAGGGQNLLTGDELVGLVQAAQAWKDERHLTYAQRVTREGADLAPALPEVGAAQKAADEGATEAEGGPAESEETPQEPAPVEPPRTRGRRHDRQGEPGMEDRGGEAGAGAADGAAGPAGPAGHPSRTCPRRSGSTPPCPTPCRPRCATPGLRPWRG